MDAYQHIKLYIYIYIYKWANGLENIISTYSFIYRNSIAYAYIATHMRAYIYIVFFLT